MGLLRVAPGGREGCEGAPPPSRGERSGRRPRGGGRRPSLRAPRGRVGPHLAAGTCRRAGVQRGRVAPARPCEPVRAHARPGGRVGVASMRCHRTDTSIRLVEAVVALGGRTAASSGSRRARAFPSCSAAYRLRSGARFLAAESNCATVRLVSSDSRAIERFTVAAGDAAGASLAGVSRCLRPGGVGVRER